MPQWLPVLPSGSFILGVPTAAIAIDVTRTDLERYVWTYMDPARLQSILASYGSRSQLLTYIRLRYAA